MYMYNFYLIFFCSLIKINANKGIKHDFPFIKIRKVPREVWKPRALQMLMNDRIMFDRYFIA